MQSPEFPIIVVFSDWELAAYEDAQDFFNHSGCEEMDFLDELDAIIDVSGQVFTYDQQTQGFIAQPGRPITFEELQARVRDHFDHKLKCGASELMSQYPRADFGDAVRFACKAIKAAD